MTTLRSAVAAILLSASAFAQIPLGTQFTYQGQLQKAGAPLTGTADFQFSLWDAQIGGGQVGAIVAVNGVSVADGLFTVALDFGAAAFNGDARWLQIAVRSPAGGGPYTTLSPRQAPTAAPNALFSLNAGRLDGLDSTAFLQSIPLPLTLSGTSATHIIRGENASTSSGASGIKGLATGATGLTYGGYFASDSTGGRGVYAEATAASGSAFGVYGQSDSTSGRGVYGQTTAATGTNYGVYGRSDSTSGRGVYGLANASSGTTYGGYFANNSPDGVGVYGSADANTGTNYGGYFVSDSTDGRGVYGLSNAATGTTFGVYGQSDSTVGRGVFGWATAATGVTTGVHGQTDSASFFASGVQGWATADTGTTFGGRFLNYSTSGRAVYGQANATTGTTYGGYFENLSTSGRGVHGEATAATGTTYGVIGSSASTDGTGVYGWATAASGFTVGVVGQTDSPGILASGVQGRATADTGATNGGWFESASTDGGVGIFARANATTGNNWGVYGLSDSTSGRGVYGRAAAGSGTIYGVYGYASTAAGGYAVYASGDMGASGVKPFRIDHPDDPANKYLLHYAAESPEIVNFYRGTAVLDDAGGAVVELPHYFAKINKTPSYQLTAVGAPMPMLHVADEIDEAALSAGATCEPGQAAPKCSFRIAGGAPGKKVSWEVKALRNDRWVQKRGAPIEVEKRDRERGTYQHPELYGQPPETGMNYDAERERPCPAPREEQD